MEVCIKAFSDNAFPEVKSIWPGDRIQLSLPDGDWDGDGVFMENKVLNVLFVEVCGSWDKIFVLSGKVISASHWVESIRPMSLQTIFCLRLLFLSEASFCLWTLRSNKGDSIVFDFISVIFAQIRLGCGFERSGDQVEHEGWTVVCKTGILSLLVCPLRLGLLTWLVARGDRIGLCW